VRGMTKEKIMKTILVDAVNAFVIKGEGIFEGLHNLLEKYPNRKIILTGANKEEREKFGLNNMPYEVFTLEHNPEKTDPEYYKKMLEYFNLTSEGVIYFEHNPDAVKSAESVGIKTFYYDKDKKDLEGLKKFIDDNI
jgi:HAD superfamily hydrolase (TIGR01509 family)